MLTLLPLVSRAVLNRRSFGSFAKYHCTVDCSLAANTVKEPLPFMSPTDGKIIQVHSLNYELVSVDFEKNYLCYKYLVPEIRYLLQHVSELYLTLTLGEVFGQLWAKHIASILFFFFEQYVIIHVEYLIHPA
jgi:hypothetical protein